MALTPEDVVNKRFQATKFREGYDQDEVDDFLDEVVVELRRLSQENEELRQRLEAAGKDGGAPAAPAAAPAPQAVAAAPQQPLTEAEEQASTTNLLTLARRLHEEHVREGVEKRDALIAEGHATAARIVSEAEATQRAQIEKFENERRSVMDKFDGERRSLEKRVEELRIFERDYRQKLKSYIEGQLRELGNSSPDQKFAPVSAAGGSDSTDKPARPLPGFAG